jgi:Ca-activated chloride channel family protein
MTSAAGILTPINSSLAELEIKQHHVDVTIEDGFTITHVEQIFNNPQNQELDALYSFPVPEHAAVGEFSYWIDGKEVIGEVLEKQQAREIHAKEKAKGSETALTEKKGFKTFEISVSPVRAQSDVRIRLVYIQKAHIDHGIGRYVYPLEEGGVDEEQLAFWSNNDKVTTSFSFNFKLRSSWPVDGLRLPHHTQAVITSKDQHEWQASFGQHSSNNLPHDADDTPSQQNSIPPLQTIRTIAPTSPAQNTVYTLDKDIVVYWRLADNLPGSVDLVTHKPDADGMGTFMLTLSPGDDLQAIDEGRDWTFILDISGSMKGKYQTLAEGVKRALKKMSINDRVKVILFNQRARELTNGYQTTTVENIRQLMQQVEQVKPGGSTNVYAGLQLASNEVDADRTSAIVLVTDGVANVGFTQQKDFIRLIKQKDIRLFTFIMGNSANRPLLQAITKASNGFALNISNHDDIVGQIMLANSKVSHQALHGIKVNFSGLKVVDVYPQQIGSLYRGQQLVLLGHYWSEKDRNVKIDLQGKISGQQKHYQSEFTFPQQSSAHPELERIWAYAAIDELQQEMENFGEDADKKQAVIDIATSHSLVTDYTSLIVVREEAFEQYGIERKNRQRVGTERQARAARSAQAVQSRRADQSKPMYSSSRPHLSGGSSGAMDIWVLLLLFPLVWLQLSSHKLNSHKTSSTK